MKNKVLLIVFFVVCVSFITAQSYESSVHSAVTQLTSRLNSPIEVSIGNIFIEGTQSTSGLSRNLSTKITHNAVETGRLIVVAPTQGIPRGGERNRTGGAQRGVIHGTYEVRGDNVNFNLQLISDPDGVIIGSSQFTVHVKELEGIEILPSNMNTHEAVREQEKIFTPQPVQTPVQSTVQTQPSVNSSAFQLTAWPNSHTNTFIDGDEITFTIEAGQNCYFKVYHIDNENNTQMIFPNTVNRDNRLTANVPRTIPDSGMRFVIQAPFGQDTIIVVASQQQFQNIEAEFTQTRSATRDVISNITRGIGMQPTQSAQSAQTVSARFHFTTLPATYYDDIHSYRKPANMTETVQAMRTEVIRQGGTFSGNEQSGVFSYTGVTGNYNVSGDRFIVNIRYTGNQLPATRGAGSNYSFTIERPRDILQAVNAVKTGIESSGGVFSGNEREGNFNASGVAGQYRVENHVNVTISKKPVLIPHAMIEKEVRGYFSGY
jgi:hypothetical protein